MAVAVLSIKAITDYDQTMPVINEAVPVVDFSRLLNREEDTNAAATIHRACCESGFFYLQDFGIGEAEIDALSEAMHWFFALPLVVKKSVARSEGNSRGYYNTELTKNIRDMKEVFDFGCINDSTMPDDHQDNRSQDGWNQWPVCDGDASFRSILTQYFEHCTDVALRLLEVVVANLGADPDILKSDFHPQHSSFLRLNYYPVNDPLSVGQSGAHKAADTGHMGVHHHTDAGALTLLLQDNVGGLEIYNRDAWIPVPPIAGTLIVNIGDIVQVWSNDLYRAPLHRVVASTSRDRYSVPYFYNPAYAATYAPLPFVNGKQAEPLYSPINWGHFRFHRQHGDYRDFGNEIQISDYKF